MKHPPPGRHNSSAWYHDDIEGIAAEQVFSRDQGRRSAAGGRWRKVLGVGAPGHVAAEGAEAYERLGELYDVWCASVDEDLAFYLAMCRDSEGPIIELGVGSGRVAVELLLDGHELIGLDGSPAMLARARARADEAGVGERLTLIEADFRPLPRSRRCSG